MPEYRINIEEIDLLPEIERVEFPNEVRKVRKM